MLPGQSYFRSTSIVASASVFGSIWCCSASSLTMWRAISGMSSRRLRSEGTRMTLFEMMS